MELHVENVNQALSDGIRWLLASGVREESRNGPVIVSPEPVMTVYRMPQERVLFSPIRDGNPFFHLFESLWMLAGRDDLEWPSQFNSKFGAYSDDGKTIWGAYGNRWRNWFGYDQLAFVIEKLKADPKTRRVVLSMWDGGVVGDLRQAFSGGKDVPCNTHAYFSVHDGELEMTVCCRSNDIIWGAYGANAVHFSMLQEYIAYKIGAKVGVYRQFSNNYHLYPALFTLNTDDAGMRLALESLAVDADTHNYYVQPDSGVPGHSAFINSSTWDHELRRFFSDPLANYGPLYHDPFFEHCAVPMYRAWYMRKRKLDSGAKHLTSGMQEHFPDWWRACWDWIARREARTAQNGVCGICMNTPCTCHRVS